MKSLAVIPARYASSRFPGKPLADLGGKSMINRVYESAAASGCFQKIVVATDDSRIYEHVQSFGGKVQMTSQKHLSGTDRCAEVAAKEPGFEWVVNIQGDEPFLKTSQIQEVLRPLRSQTKVKISTLVKKIDPLSDNELFNPNVVKVVMGKDDRVLYFSRQAIPHLRGIPQNQWLEHHTFYKHIGLYAFQRKTLLKLTKLKPSPIEQAESLEQLRWLGAGFSIFANFTSEETFGIDSPEDLKLALARIG